LALPAAMAEVAIIMHPGATDASISIREVSDVFLGKTRRLRDGTTLLPLDQRHDSKVKERFYLKITKKSAAQLKAYWARQVFTGQGTPPLVLNSDRDIKELVSNNPNMIGYIDAAYVDDTVKVMLLID
jgi:ABC-type phosphate transport system substrate-binding protein